MYIFLLRFAFGNYWTLGIMWPDYAPTLFEPNQWCHRTLYVFALTQLGVVWGVIALLLLLLLALVVCQVSDCLYFYKFSIRSRSCWLDQIKSFMGRLSALN